MILFVCHLNRQIVLTLLLAISKLVGICMEMKLWRVNLSANFVEFSKGMELSFTSSDLKSNM